MHVVGDLGAVRREVRRKYYLARLFRVFRRARKEGDCKDFRESHPNRVYETKCKGRNEICRQGKLLNNAAASENKFCVWLLGSQNE